MKATVIISQEYHMNTPTIFINVNGNYYGDLLYAEHRNFPQVDYWSTAISSDSHRGFTVREVEINEDTLAELIKLHNVVEANESMIVKKSYPYIKKDWKVKRGSKYAAWKAATDQQSAEIKAEYERNAPYDSARRAAYTLRQKLIINL